MKPGLLLLVITASASALGYLEIRHQAERETWRVEASQLGSRLDAAERLAEERAKTLADAKKDNLREREAKAELAELEAQILDAAAELARIESDRVVARGRADTAIRDLQDQVRALTTIEMDMAALGKQRQRLQNEVEKIEERLQQTEIGAAERQKRSESLDRDIASLAVRKETMKANLGMAEKAMAAKALASMVEQPAKIVTLSPEKSPAPPPKPLLGQPAAPTAILESTALEDSDRSRGLYQFGSLSADPSAKSDGQSGLPPLSSSLEGSVQQEGASSWAEDQYLLGLRLLSTAEQNSGTRELNDAILAFKAVLGEWPKQRDPMRWAIARSDLGYALALLGKRQRNAGILEQAAVACRDALDQFKRSETPLLWAAAQHHLGVSLGGLADVSGDSDLRQASIEALEEAVAVFNNAGAAGDAQKVERRLREASAQIPAAVAEPGG